MNFCHLVAASCLNHVRSRNTNFVFDYFQIQPDPHLGELVFGSQNNTLDETNGVNNAVSCYIEAVQFSASFVTSLFASF